jgi:hypothetical protein
MPERTASSQKLILWVIWFALVSSIVAYQLILGHGIPYGPNVPSTETSPFAAVAIGEIIAASVIRWLLIPKTRGAGKLLVLMIIGLALSEGAEFFGLFLVANDQPETKLAIWILSLLSALQFMPVYAERDQTKAPRSTRGTNEPTPTAQS